MVVTVDVLHQEIQELRQRLDKLETQSERLIIFIDRSNLDQSFRQNNDCPHLRLDYQKLVEVLRKGRSLQQVRIYYSDYQNVDNLPPDERTEWERRKDFYNVLRHYGFLLVGVNRTYGRTSEKGLDVTLAVDMGRVSQAGACNTIMLVAGDADYCTPVDVAQREFGTRIEVAFFPQQTSRELQHKASKFIDLSAIKDQLLRDPRAGREG